MAFTSYQKAFLGIGALVLMCAVAIHSQQQPNWVECASFERPNVLGCAINCLLFRNHTVRDTTRGRTRVVCRCCYKPNAGLNEMCTVYEKDECRSGSTTTTTTQPVMNTTTTTTTTTTISPPLDEWVEDETFL